MPKKGYKQTQEHIEKRMIHHRGSKRSPETCWKFSKAITKAYDEGKVMWFRAKPRMCSLKRLIEATETMILKRLNLSSQI